MGETQYTRVHKWLQNVDEHSPPETQPPFDSYGTPIYRQASKSKRPQFFTNAELNTDFTKRELAQPDTETPILPSTQPKRYGSVKILQKYPDLPGRKPSKSSLSPAQKLKNVFSWESKNKQAGLHTPPRTRYPSKNGTATPQSILQRPRGITFSPTSSPPKIREPIPRKPIGNDCTGARVITAPARTIQLHKTSAIDPSGSTAASISPPTTRTRALSRSNAVRKFSNPVTGFEDGLQKIREQAKGLSRRNAVHRPESPFAGMSDEDRKALSQRRGSNVKTETSGKESVYRVSKFKEHL